MNPIASDQLFLVLEKINITPVETFKNFPDIIRAGSYQLPRDEFDYLLAEGYLEVEKSDSFGKLLHLSALARNILKNNE